MDPATDIRAHRRADPAYTTCPNCNRVGCSSCNFFGVIQRGACAHTWRTTVNIAPCLWSCICTTCGAISTLDTSD